MERNIMGWKVSRGASRLAEDKSFSVGDKVRVLEYHTDGDVGKEFQVGEVYTVDDIETWTTMPENKEVGWLYSEEADALLDPGKVEKVSQKTSTTLPDYLEWNTEMDPEAYGLPPGDWTILTLAEEGYVPRSLESWFLGPGGKIPAYLPDGTWALVDPWNWTIVRQENAGSVEGAQEKLLNYVLSEGRVSTVQSSEKKAAKVAMQPLYMPPQDGPTSIPQDFREVSPNRWVWEESPEGKTYEISFNRYEYFARVREEDAQRSTPVSSIGNSGGVFNSFDRAAQAIRSHAQRSRVGSRVEEREPRPGGFLTQAQQWGGPKSASSHREKTSSSFEDLGESLLQVGLLDYDFEVMDLVQYTEEFGEDEFSEKVESGGYLVPIFMDDSLIIVQPNGDWEAYGSGRGGDEVPLGTGSREDFSTYLQENYGD